MRMTISGSSIARVRSNQASSTPPRIPLSPYVAWRRLRVLEFDQAGNLLHHWGGPGNGYDWPESNHGITIDYKGNVWIGGNGRGKQAARPADGEPDESAAAATQSYLDNQVLKFTQDGQFLMQIGKPHSSKGSNDIENLRLPAKTFIDKQTNEVYVADGYGNHRVIVYDADTGAYKRHWGAYGHKPDDADLGNYNPDAPPAPQFRNPVHCADLSVDRLLYVCDRANDRIQVFKPDGTFVKEGFIAKRTLGSGSAWDIAFSKDPQQKYIYLADGENDRIHILLRDTLQVLTTFGEGGRQPGEFYGPHSIATDSKGNIYVTETYRGQRVQKFVYKGLGPVTKEDQGVLWPKTQKITGQWRHFKDRSFVEEIPMTTFRMLFVVALMAVPPLPIAQDSMKKGDPGLDRFGKAPGGRQRLLGLRA